MFGVSSNTKSTSAKITSAKILFNNTKFNVSSTFVLAVISSDTYFLIIPSHGDSTTTTTNRAIGSAITIIRATIDNTESRHNKGGEPAIDNVKRD
jgi:hypothetical protein